jgi:restriction system protein
MAKRRRKSTGDDAAVPLLVAAMVLVVLVQWLAEQADRHPGIAAAVVFGFVAAAVLRIWAKAEQRRIRRDRLVTLRLPLPVLDGLGHRDFEFACRDLLRRDGMSAEQVGQGNDQVVDVKARDVNGRVLVLQCKHTTRGHNVGVRVLYEVNGTARAVHGADIAVVVTNGGFTRNAREWGARHGIYLVDRTAMERWASRGESLYDVLGIPSYRSAAG